MGEEIMSTVGEFNGQAKALQSKFEKEDKSDIVYHFRSSARGFDILKSKELLFADYKYLQMEHDGEEVDLGFNAILKSILKRSTGEGDIWYRFGGNFFKFKDRLSIYVLSCCYDKSEEKIWKKYGDNGRGVALGFNFLAEDVVDSNNLEDVRYFLRVLYDPKEFESRINEFLDLANNYFACLSKKNEKELAEHLASHLLPYIPALKREEFSWEKECRFVMLPGVYLSGGARQPCNLPLERFRTLVSLL